MSAPFTPGPWQLKTDYPHRPDCVTIVANGDGDGHADGSTTYSYDFIATCEDEFGEYAEHAQANANLIAAAPDLFAACEAVLAMSDTSKAHCGGAVKLAHAALVKARGGL